MSRNLSINSSMEFIKRYTANPLLRNYLKLFSVDVLVKGSGIILLPIYLRLMTQEEYGLYGYLAAIVSAFSLVCNLGIYAAQSKLYHDYPSEQRGTVLFTLNTLLFVFIVVLLSVILLFNVDYFIADFLFKDSFEYGQYRSSILLGTFVSVYSVMLVNYFLTSEDIRKVQLFNLARVILINAIVLGVLWVSTGGDHALSRIKYANIVEFIIIIGFGGFYIHKMILHFDRAIAIKALWIGLPIMISAILGIFVNLSDRYFIEKYGTLRDMSIYNLALTFSGIIPFIFASFQNIWLPQFLKEKNSEVNRLRTKKMVIRLTIGFIIISLGIVFALQIMLMTHIIDTKYEPIMPLLPIVLTTAVVTSLTSMYSNHLIYINKLYVIILIGVPAAILGIGINIWLVPLYGIYGAAIASLFVNLTFLVSYFLITRIFYSRGLGPDLH